MYGPVNSGLKVKVQVKLQCKSATRYQITGQGGCSEEIVPWPLGRSSCHGMATLLQEPGLEFSGAGRWHVRRCSASQALCGEDHPWFSHIQEDCSRSRRRRPFQFQKSKTGSSFPPVSLCITTGQHRPFALEQGLPNPAPWTGTPVRTWATQLEVRLV